MEIDERELVVSYTAFVPARSGSKRVPNKNITPLAGKPLFVWTLEACVKADQVDSVIFSTDSEEYWALATKHVTSTKLELDFRSSDEAGDNVKIFDYLKDKSEKIFAGKQGAFLLTLPTVPLRTCAHVNEAIAKYETEGAPVFSATSYGFPISFAFDLTDDGGWSPLFDDTPMTTGNTRSQGQKEIYHPNGAIYVRAISDLANPNLMTLYENARPYLMDRFASVDIDNEIDFKLAEALLS